jgi:hypothetical protein
MPEWQKLQIIGRCLSLSFLLQDSCVVFRLLTNLFAVEWCLAAIASILSFMVLTDFHFATRPDRLFFLFGTLIAYSICSYISARER